jgi:hypothetical protein
MSVCVLVVPTSLWSYESQCVRACVRVQCAGPGARVRVFFARGAPARALKPGPAAAREIEQRL